MSTIKEYIKSNEKRFLDELFAVSYTHLDVYKRQASKRRKKCLMLNSRTGDPD